MMRLFLALHLATVALAEPQDAALSPLARGKMADDAEDYATAEALYKEAVAADPSDWDAKFHLGRLLSNERRDYDEAEALLMDVIDLNPEDAGARYGLALILKNERMNKEAASIQLQKASQPDPTNGNARAIY